MCFARFHEEQFIYQKLVFKPQEEHITNFLNAALRLPLVIFDMEVFTSEDVTKMLWKKLVVVIGDSIQRCVYKDLVCLLSPGSNTRYLTSKELKAKGEIDFLNDKLLQGGQLGDVKTGINYREVRQFDNGTSVIKFYFVTRCYSDHLESVLNELKTMQPHAVIMNSCLWDLHRYGPRGPDSYHINMKKLMDGLKRVIPSDAVFIWNGTLPLDSKCKGGFLLPYFENIPAQEIIEANFIAADIVRSRGFVFLDLHSIFVNQLYHRAKDGIHWNHFAHRRISNLILLHLCRAWNLPVPKRMPLDIPREPHLYPLAERPHNASFGSYTSHLQIDRYGFNPSPDARYVVQKPNTYKDRFRLMGSPIAISSTIVGKDKMTSPVIPGLGSDVNKDSGSYPRPVYASSPVETVSKTRSLLPQNENITTPTGSSLSEGHLDQELGLSKNLNQEFKDSSLDQRHSSEMVLACYGSNKISASNDAYGKENTLTGKSVTNTVSQSSSLVIQVSSTCTAGRNMELSSMNRQSTTYTSSSKPALSSQSYVSQMNLPVNQVTPSQVTKATPSHATKTTSCIDKQVNKCALKKAVASSSHVSQINIPVNQVSPQVTKATPSHVTKTTCIDKQGYVCASNKAALSSNHMSQVNLPVNQVTSQVTKTTAGINQGSAICTSVNKTLASVIGPRPQLRALVNSVTMTTQCTGKENAPCTTGSRVCSGADVPQLHKNDLPIHKQPSNTMTMSTSCTPQQVANVSVTSNQVRTPLNLQSQKEPCALKSSVDSAIKTKDKPCVSSSIAYQNKPSNTNGAPKLPSKTQTITVVAPGKRKAPVEDMKRKTSNDIVPKKQKLPDDTRTSTSGKSHSDAKKALSEKAPSTNNPRVSSGGQKRKATGDGGSNRNAKQSKVSEVKKKAADLGKSSNELKRKAPTDTPVSKNIKQPQYNLEPPAKRGKNEHNNSTPSYQYPMRNALPLSGQHSTSPSTSQTSIPVYSGNRIQGTNILPQNQCIPSYNFAQNNCYWMGSQQSLQDIQQQQQWFNTLLSRGRAGPYMNSAQPSNYYNPNMQSWQYNQGYYYNNNYRY